jgi:ribonucleoside-diphosphate reductase alpha chain
MELTEWLGKDNQIGIKMWHSKYQNGDETLDQFFDRVSGGNEEVKRLLMEKKFLPGGRAITNRGVKDGGSAFNCYSSGFCPDDLKGIMQLNTNIALTFKAQGGQGLSMSMVRPKGTPVGNHYVSDGIEPFMEMFNCTTASISQGGSRKGALMISLDIRHKEASKFIRLKANGDKLTKTNLSLEIDDEFMEAVREYYKSGTVMKIHEVREYEGHKVEYDIVPIELYKLMMQTVYDYGEPGCIFTERFRNYNLMQYDNDYQIVTANPCGEQPLPEGMACNLGSMNLSEYVKNPFTNDARFDYESFLQDVGTAIECLDTLIDENKDRHPLAEQRENSINYRNIGLGVMGYASCIMKLGLVYGSSTAIEFTKDLMNMMFKTAVIASSKLAQEKGTFPKYKPCIFYSDIMQEHFTDAELAAIKEHGLRNCSLLSIAPTGSISNLLGESGGIEPEFAIEYSRKTESMGGNTYSMKCKAYREYCEKYGEQKEKPKQFITSSEIAWKDRIDTQSEIQRHVDTAISSTVNLPKDISREEIERLYLYAWEKGLKGVTIFRSGCKRGAVLETKQEPVPEERPLDKYEPITRRTLGKVLSGRTYVMNIACGKLYVTINNDGKGNIVEVFVDSSKGGGCAANSECIGRLASTMCRSGIKIDAVIDSIKGVKCAACSQVKGSGSRRLDGLSCGDAVAKAIESEYKNNGNKVNTVKPEEKKQEENPNSKEYAICPECGEKGLVFEGGCNTCKVCGWSKCG